MRRLVALALAGSALTASALAGCAQQQGHTGSAGTPAPLTTAPVSTTPVTTAPLTTPADASEVPVPPKLSPHGEDVLARAKRSGARAVVLTVSADRGSTDQVADRVRALGATVEATDPTIGYLRVSTPVELAERVAAVEGVSRVDVDEPLSNADPTP
ncbi:hypothetical protein [Saccharothrix sp. HUAS TT1]|uniref:hypothetical protein n=1 Tax=unclassified Saccharothrix TaxID=2593673 RepID=UPI00345B681B